MTSASITIESNRSLRLTILGRLIFLGLVGAVLFACVGWVFLPPLKLSLFIGVFVYVCNQLASGLAYHRRFTHHTFQTSRMVDRILLLLGATSLQGPVLTWVALHRKHHRHVETERDPHSPSNYLGRFSQSILDEVYGLAAVAFGGWLLNVPDDLDQYLRKADRQPDVVFFDRAYGFILALWILIPAGITYLIFDPTTAVNVLIWGTLVPMGLSVFSTLTMNAIGHSSRFKAMRFGFQRYKGPHLGNSTNIGWMALPVLGEHLHNTHHSKPWSAQNGTHWRQLDITYGIICLLERLKLVWGVRRLDQKRGPR